VYNDQTLDAARDRLLRVDGVLVWVDPIGKRDRAELDAVLRETSSRGDLGERASGHDPEDGHLRRCCIGREAWVGAPIRIGTHGLRSSASSSRAGCVGGNHACLKQNRATAALRSVEGHAPPWRDAADCVCTGTSRSDVPVQHAAPAGNGRHRGRDHSIVHEPAVIPISQGPPPLIDPSVCSRLGRGNDPR